MNPKVVCITGCTRELGRAMVDEFMKLGWIVAGCGERGRCAGPASQARRATLFDVCDVSKEADVQRFCERAVAQVGVPDLLLNNAAIINPNQPLWEMSEQDIHSIIDVNIKGPIAMMRHLLPQR